MNTNSRNFISALAMRSAASRRRSRIGTTFAAGLVALAVIACDSSATPVASVAATADGASNDASNQTTEAQHDLAPPDATLPAALPAEAADGYAPAEFVGEPLPLLDSNESDDPAIGAQVPVMIGYDIEGEVVTIDPAKQGKTMIVVLAHWCPVCNKEVPEINALAADGSIPEDVNVVAVLSSSEPAEANWPPGEWIQRMGWPYRAVLDGIVETEVDGLTMLRPAALEYYGFQGFPSVVLVGGDGAVVDRWSKGRGQEALRERITAAFGS